MEGDDFADGTKMYQYVQRHPEAAPKITEFAIKQRKIQKRFQINAYLGIGTLQLIWMVVTFFLGWEYYVPAVLAATMFALYFMEEWLFKKNMRDLRKKNTADNPERFWL